MRWYLSRLASMGPAEIVWRAALGCDAAAGLGPLEKSAGRAGAPLEPAASRLLPRKLHAGGAPMEHIPVFDLEFPLGFEFDWHRDYRYGRQVEPGFAGALNIRDTAVSQRHQVRVGAQPAPVFFRTGICRER